MLSALSLFTIGFGLWLIFAWTRYAEEYSQLNEGWHLGATRMVELTLVPEDISNLACASDLARDGLHCAYRKNLTEFEPGSPDERRILRPYNSVKNELLLGAGLWSSLDLRGRVPSHRFTVVCNFQVVGVLRSVSLRWTPTGNFAPLSQSVAAGKLSDCVLPE
jgi:hypothetical protein